MRRLCFLLGAATCLCLFATDIFGQCSPACPPPPSGEGWRVQIIPYLWGTDFKGTVGIGDREASVHATFGDILKELNFAFMGFIQANYEKVDIQTDVMYMNLSDEHATPGPLFSSVDAGQKAFILTPEAGYRFIGSETRFMEVLGGFRLWHVNSDLNFQPGLLPAVDVSGSRTWLDGIAALRAKVELNPTWYISTYADAGGGGSNFTYQLLGVAGAEFKKHYAIVFGYRYLMVNYNKNDFLLNTRMGGPVVGFAFKF
jgi:hypothetical protein